MRIRGACQDGERTKGHAEAWPFECDEARDLPKESGSRAATADDGANADETREQ